MSHYRHLSIEEREKLYLLHGQGKSFRCIAAELGRSPSTISREYKRGRCWRNPYLPSRAQYRYEKRRLKCGKKRILADPGARKVVRGLIERHWSPEQISNRLKLEDNALQLSWITIYRAVWAGVFDAPRPSNGHKKYADYFVHKLRKKGRKRRKGGGRQGQFEIRHTIDERPLECENRTVTGHFEADSVLGTRKGARIVNLVDRCSRFTLIAKVGSADAQMAQTAMCGMLSRLPEEAAISVTPDRGHEFARYREVESAFPNVTFYFPPPHSPWKRGTNENTNGLIREYLPKKKDMTPVSDEQMQLIADSLNLRPRKCLNWRTPLEIFSNKLLHLT